jgi:transposase
VTRFAKLGKSAKYIAVQLNKKRSEPVHPTTVSRYLRLGTKCLDYLPVVTKRKLRIENKQKRTVFCRRHRGHDFKRCVFVDGKTLRFKYGDGKLRSHCWQDPKNRKCKPPIDWGPDNAVHIYAGVSWKGRSKLVCVPLVTGSDSSQRFKSSHACKALLELKETFDALHGVGKHEIIMDKASQHTSAETRSFIQQKNIKVWQEFPPQSPDLNIIENIWKLLDGRLMERKPRTWEGFKKIAQEEWDKIPQSDILHCVEAIPKRMNRILRAKGAWLWQQSSKKKGKVPWGIMEMGARLIVINWKLNLGVIDII